MKRYQGFSIVELMIALLIGSFLVLGLVQVFTANKQGFRIQEASSRIQENGRMAIEMLSRDVRAAGFMGCANVLAGGSVNNIVDKTKYSSKGTALLEALDFDGTKSIEFFNDVTSTASTSLAKYGLTVGTATGNIVSGTDALVLKSAEPCEGGKVVSYDPTSAQFKIEDASACGLVQNEVVVVANCNGAEIFAITNNPQNGSPSKGQYTVTHANNLNTTNKLSGSYDKESYIYRYRTEVYYVAYNDRNEPALYLMRLTSAAAASPFETLELASGIEDMQVAMGEDTDGDFVANRYIDSGVNMDNVVAMKISLLSRSDDGVVTTGSQTYYFNGSTHTASDKRLRSPFQATVALRNRVR